MLTLAILFCAFLCLFVACSGCLWLGARWAGASRSLPRAALAVLLVVCAFLGVLAAAARFYRPLYSLASNWSEYPIGRPLILGLEVFATVGASWLILKFVLRLPWGALFKAWLAAAAPVALAVPVTTYVIWPHLCEPVRLHSGSMCPTLLGKSQSAFCPNCGEIAYTPWITEIAPIDADGRMCTCSHCWQSHRSQALSADILSPDGFMVNKLLTPERWDLVFYRAPHIVPGPDAPAFRFVKRIVGLPGEEIVIKDGGVWVNGERLTLPEDIAGLEFHDKLEGHLPIRWGSVERPAKLGPDEYFVLGDYGYRSDDSRTWQNNLEGHAPYALPASYVEGVVDLRYSPLSRWHIFR